MGVGGAKPQVAPYTKMKTPKEIISDLIEEAEKSNDMWSMNPAGLLEKYLEKGIKVARKYKR